ncbi:MAG: tRNA lysidine(34) synthetase TilS [Bacteroidales bacterium]|nr:tRNA lysidine(34) synthetase TilS [Bacteroidales bacterium]
MRILLAVSGGIDSMYLAENAGDLFPGSSFAVAHCNFRLRGAASDGDEAFVRSWCEAHALTIFVQSFDTPTFAHKHGISLEMAARELRYRWFAQLCSEEGFDAVAVAHNSDDDAETMLLNLLRGSGTHGLRGMAPEGPIPFSAGPARLLRPMLGLERKTIAAWMQAHGKSWREDHTNADDRIKRNKLRLKAFPVFEEINPAFRATLRSDRDHIAQADDIAEEYFRTALPYVRDARGRIDTTRLLEYTHWRYLLFRLTGPLGLDAGHLAQLEAALAAGQTAETRYYGPLTLSRGFLSLPEGETAPHVHLDTLPCPTDWKELLRPGTLILDADLLPRQPVLRAWQPGDWMIPLGMKGRKKLSDLFNDLKLSAEDKVRARVMDYPGIPGRAALLYPWRIDDSLKVTEKTKRILIVKSEE